MDHQNPQEAQEKGGSGKPRSECRSTVEQPMDIGTGFASLKVLAKETNTSRQLNSRSGTQVELKQYNNPNK